jgi:hypothetical protein
MNWGIFKTDVVSEAYKKMKAEELKGNQHKLDVDKDGKIEKDDLAKLRKEDAAEQIEEAIDAKDYHVTSEKSTMTGGHRPKIVHKEKGTTMHLSQHSYKSPSDAKAHAQAYLDAYHKIGPNAADRAGAEFASKNKDKHVTKKEGLEIFSEKELDILISEVVSKDAKAGDWISDFVKSDAPQFADKSPEKRKQMALAAYYDAQKKESTNYESFLVLDEAKEQGEIVKTSSKEIKHANMKDKQDDADVMEPNSEGEADFIDKHTVNVTDDPGADFKPGSGTKQATKPTGKGAGSYDGNSKLSDKDKASVKEAKTATGKDTEEVIVNPDDGSDTTKSEAACSSKKAKSKAA